MNDGAPRAAVVVDAIAAPLDVARRALFAGIARSDVATRVFGARDTRVPLLASAQLVLLFAMAAARPLWLFVVGPLVLGVPHLASDVRYLVLRRHVGKGVILVAVLASAFILALRGSALAGAPIARAARLEILAAAAWIAVAVAAGAHERRALLPLVTVPLVAAGGLLAAAHASFVAVAVAHLHNLVGVLAWGLWFRRGARRALLLPGLLLTGGALLLASDPVLRLAARAGGLEAFGVDLRLVGALLAPGTTERVGLSAALLFVFLQAAHYAAWLLWIPQEELRAKGTFTFRMTGRALVKDFGPFALAGVAALTIVFIASAFLAPLPALGAYVSLASFHGYFEIAMLAYFAARGGNQARS